MNFFWHIAPLTRMIIPLLFGVILAVNFLPFAPWFKFVLLIELLLVLCLHWFTRFFKTYKFRHYTGILLNILIFSAGIALVQAHKTTELKSHFKNLALEGKFLIEISSNLQEKTGSFKTEGEVVGLLSDTHKDCSGTVLIYLEKDSLMRNLQIGDLILANLQFNEIEPPKNPHQFDYKKYLSYQKIDFQAYLRADNYFKIREEKWFNIYRFFEAIRYNLVEKFDEFNFSPKEKAVASALILGDKDHLDPQLSQAYASAGAMHVLAVSGLHVGIVYLVLSFMFKFLNHRKLRVYKFFVILILMWSYAVLTGLSPSVLRATVMFSFIAGAKNIDRHSNIYNVMAASAMSLIIINPYIIFNVGFQLSYLAVVGILYLQPKIYSLFIPNGKILNWIWELSAVSIAAQLATFPLGLLYFHQFPSYFLLSNLIVIPAASLILNLGIPFLAFSWIPYVADFLGWLLSSTIFILNSIVEFAERLPYSVISGISISNLEVFLIFSIIIFALLFLYRPSTTMLRLAYGSVLFLVFFQAKEAIDQNNQKFIVVYQLNKHSGIDFISGRQHYFLGDREFYSDKGGVRFNITNNWCFLGLEPEIFIDVAQDSIIEVAGDFHRKKSLLQFGNSLFFIANSPEQLKLLKPDEVDFILLRNYDTYSDAIELGNINCPVIIDGSTPTYKLKYVYEKLKSPRLYSTREQGAFSYIMNDL